VDGEEITVIPASPSESSLSDIKQLSHGILQYITLTAEVKMQHEAGNVNETTVLMHSYTNNVHAGNIRAKCAVMTPSTL
jgi:hypothetical protein